jgi:hypothetical protein
MARDSLDHGRALGRSPVHLRVTRFQALVFLRWLREVHQVTTADRLRREHLTPRRNTSPGAGKHGQAL